MNGWFCVIAVVRKVAVCARGPYFFTRLLLTAFVWKPAKKLKTAAYFRIVSMRH